MLCTDPSFQHCHLGVGCISACHVASAQTALGTASAPRVPAVQPQLQTFVSSCLAWFSSLKPAWQEWAPLGKELASCSEHLHVTYICL